MRSQSFSLSAMMACVSAGLLLAGCTSSTGPPVDDWFNMEMTDVLTGEVFAVNDFSGKVILLGTMAQWCPNCLVQQANVRKAYEQLGRPEDLILISLDVDVNEDEASLKAYAEEWGFEWRFAVSPLLVSRPWIR